MILSQHYLLSPTIFIFVVYFTLVYTLVNPLDKRIKPSNNKGPQRPYYLAQIAVDNKPNPKGLENVLCIYSFVSNQLEACVDK